MNTKLFSLIFLIILIKSEVTIYNSKYCLEFLDYLGYTELEVDMDDFYDVCINQTKIVLKDNKYIDILLDKIENEYNFNVYEFYDI